MVFAFPFVWSVWSVMVFGNDTVWIEKARMPFVNASGIGFVGVMVLWKAKGRMVVPIVEAVDKYRAQISLMYASGLGLFVWYLLVGVSFLLIP